MKFEVRVRLLTNCCQIWQYYASFPLSLWWNLQLCCFIEFLNVILKDIMDSKKSKRLVAYCDDMSREFPYMKRSKKGENSIFCSICRVDFTIGHGGCNDIVRHILTLPNTSTRKRQRRQRRVISKRLLTSFRNRTIPSSMQRRYFQDFKWNTTFPWLSVTMPVLSSESVWTP